MYNDAEVKQIIVTNILKMLNSRKLINKDQIDKLVNKFSKNAENIFTIVTDKDQIDITFEITTHDKPIGKSQFNNLEILSNNKYSDHLKIVIVSYKPSLTILRIVRDMDNLEIFLQTDLMINIIDHVFVPKHMLLNSEEKLEFLSNYNTLERDLPKIDYYDKITRYYGAKIGDVFRIIRYAKNGIHDIQYRIVVDI